MQDNHASQPRVANIAAVSTASDSAIDATV
jgi:hypothetical protein